MSLRLFFFGVVSFLSSVRSVLSHYTPVRVLLPDLYHLPASVEVLSFPSPQLERTSSRFLLSAFGLPPATPRASRDDPWLFANVCRFSSMWVYVFFFFFPTSSGGTRICCWFCAFSLLSVATAACADFFSTFLSSNLLFVPFLSWHFA